MNNKNKSLYITRFKKMIEEHYALVDDRLRYKKRKKESSEFKTIPYIFEVYKKIDKLHKENNHLNLHDFKNILIKTDFYLEGLNVILKEYYLKCPECYNKYYARNIMLSPVLILDEGPNYRVLCDITI